MKCVAIIVDLDGDGEPEVVLLPATVGVATVYKQTAETWGQLGAIPNSNCKGVREALLNGDFELVTPESKELRAAGQQLYVQTACK
jgi:hypothetical protein